MASAKDHLATIVQRDRAPLYRSRIAFAEKAGVKDRTIAKIELGEPGGYAQRTKEGVEDALHWTPGSFDHVAAGGEPTYVPDPEFEELRRLWHSMSGDARSMLLRIARETGT